MARLLLGVSGGIAAYKALELARLATQAGHAVRVIQTEASLRFVGAASFEGITGAPVLSDLWERDPARGAFPDQAAPDHDPISHLQVVADADVLLVAPASANTLAKLAHGLADDLLSTAALAATCPVAVAPAMNSHMLAHPATRANLALLRERGVTVLDPAEGALASRGEWGAGRLPEPAELLAAVEALAPAGASGRARGSTAPTARSPAGPAAENGADPRGPATGSWVGLRVVVTAGGTQEPIDSVRYVGNRSSGRMGWALAGEAARRGAAVTVVAANVALPRNPRVVVVDVQTAAQLQAACLTAFEDCDVLLMAAAVADYRPAGGGAAVGKLKKDRAERLEIAFERTEDVLEALSARRRAGQTLVGFAAEHGEDAVAQGRAKLERKALDLVVVNDISRTDIGFDVADNEVTLVGREGERRSVPLGRKEEVAAAILDEVEQVRARPRARA